MKRFAGLIAFVVVALGVGVFTYILKVQREKQEKLEENEDILVSTVENVDYPTHHSDKEALVHPDADSINTI